MRDSRRGGLTGEKKCVCVCACVCVSVCLCVFACV